VDQAEKAFSTGNLSEARQLIAPALKQKPDDAMAGYVERVIERAQKTRPAASQNLSAR
jgi:hypothetical protein